MLDSTFAFLQSERQYVEKMPKSHMHRMTYEVALREVQSLRSLPAVVTICGSGRFKDEILAASENLTLGGNIVLAPNVFAREEGQFDKPGLLVSEPQKALLDVLHFKKIDLSVRVHVVNVGGYIGDSVHKEITYAVRTRKLVTFLEDHVIPWDTRAKRSISTHHYLKAIQERLELEGE